MLHAGPERLAAGEGIAECLADGLRNKWSLVGAYVRDSTRLCSIVWATRPKLAAVGEGIAEYCNMIDDTMYTIGHVGYMPLADIVTCQHRHHFALTSRMQSRYFCSKVRYAASVATRAFMQVRASFYAFCLLWCYHAVHA